MNRDLFLAILAMDSYNRGYGASINLDQNVSQIGYAIIGDDAVDILGTDAETAGFYASAYDVTNVAGFSAGETVISYRGTNTVPYYEGIIDAINGYGVGGGHATGEQARLAIEFYKAVAAGNDLQAANISLTGHSLGGGLAGFVATIYGQDATIFDNMPFELAALHALALADGSQPSLVTQQWRDLFYDGQTPWANDLTGISAFATQGELLWSLGLRTLQQTSVGVFPSFTDLAALDLHSQPLLVTLMWAHDNDKIDWHAAGESLGRALFSSDVAASLNGIEARVGPGGSAVAVLQGAIAYSAISEGERPFGDTGIRVMFDDADDLGKALSVANGSVTLAASADAVAKVLVQYAGKLALGDVEGLSAAFADGVLSLSGDGEVLAGDFGSDLWSYGQAHSAIVGRKELTDTALAALDGAGAGSDMRTGMRWLWDDTDSSIIDRVLFRTGNQALSTVLLDRHALGGDVSLFVAGDGNDTIFGASSDENEFVHGGGGNDSIFGGDGDDLIAGGAGNDTLSGGAGRDFLAGGTGIDTIDLGENATSVSVSIRAVDPVAGDSRAAIQITNGGDVDRAIDVERILLTNGNDSVAVTDLGPTTGDQTELSRLDYIDFGSAGLALNVDTLDLSQAGRADVSLLGVNVADAGIYVDLSDARRQTVDYLYDLGMLHTTGTGGPELTVRNANTVVATDFDDYLVGNGGTAANGEGYSTLYGRDGDDTLVGAGWESHLYGGTGADTFKVGSNTIIEDGEVGAGDRVTYGGIPIFRCEAMVDGGQNGLLVPFHLALERLSRDRVRVAQHRRNSR